MRMQFLMREALLLMQEEKGIYGNLWEIKSYITEKSMDIIRIFIGIQNFPITKIIAFNPTLTSVSSYGRRIDIITITRPAQSPSFTKPILDSNGLAFIVPEDETMLSIHSLNEILVVDTDKNKYFFYWDETAENFLRLEDLPELDVETTKTEVGFSFGSWLVGNPVL